MESQAIICTSNKRTSLQEMHQEVSNPPERLQRQTLSRTTHQAPQGSLRSDPCPTTHGQKDPHPCRTQVSAGCRTAEGAEPVFRAGIHGECRRGEYLQYARMHGLVIAQYAFDALPLSHYLHTPRQHQLADWYCLRTL